MHNDPKFAKSLTQKQWAIVLEVLDDADENMAEALNFTDDEDEANNIYEDRDELNRIICTLTLGDSDKE